jgi:hypothetical protein
MKTNRNIFTKLFLGISLLTLFINAGFSQNVGINSSGNRPDTSAMLDIASTSKGMLIPRVSLTSLTDASTILTPATSLLVYNTNTSTSVTLGVGYYFNSGTSGSPVWQKLVATSDTVVKSVTPNGDMIKLSRFPMGEIYMNGNATNTSCVTNTWIKAAGSTSISSGAWDFWNGGISNRLVYTGASRKMFHIACTISLTNTGGNSTNMKAALYKNGTILSNGIVMTRLNGGTDYTSTAIHVMTDMAAGDYLELWINSSNTQSILIDYMNMFAMGISMGMD